MKKLFEAIKNKHLGCEILDVKFSTTCPILPEELSNLDEKMAIAVRDAKETTIEELTGGIDMSTTA